MVDTLSSHLQPPELRERLVCSTFSPSERWDSYTPPSDPPEGTGLGVSDPGDNKLANRQEEGPTKYKCPGGSSRGWGDDAARAARSFHLLVCGGPIPQASSSGGTGGHRKTHSQQERWLKALGAGGRGRRKPLAGLQDAVSANVLNNSIGQAVFHAARRWHF